MANIIDYSSEGFIVPYELNGGRYYVAVNPEMFTVDDELDRTGRFFIYCLHPKKGSCQFSIFIDRSRGYWASDDAPNQIKTQFINDIKFIEWIGEQIEERKSISIPLNG